MRMRAVVSALMLWGVCCGMLGCGKYGPPVRVHDQPAPQNPAPDTDDSDDDQPASP